MTRKAWRYFACALSFVLLALAPAARAAEASEEAKRHFSLGVQLYQDRNFTGALVEFEASFQMNPTAAALQNIAVCQKGLFRYAEAIATLERMTRGFSAQLSDADRRAAEDAIREMKALLGTVLVRTTAPGARVTINDQPIAPEALASPIALAAGQHHIVAEAPGYQRAEQTISVVSGQKDRPVVLILAPLPAPAAAPAPSALPAPPQPPQLGWYGSVALVGDTLGGGLPQGYEPSGAQRGGSLGVAGGYRLSRRIAFEAELDAASHAIAACPTGQPGCGATTLKYTLGTARFGPNIRVMSDGRGLRIVGTGGLGVAAHNVSSISSDTPSSAKAALESKKSGAGPSLRLGGGAEVNWEHFLFELGLALVFESKGDLPLAKHLSEAGLQLRIGYGAWTP